MAGAAGIADYRPLTFRQLYIRQRAVLFHQYEQTITIATILASTNGVKENDIKKIRNPYA